MPDDSEEKRSFKAGLEFCGEVLVPGGSNLVKGDWKQAGIHAALGVAARSVFGVPGLLLVSSDSIVKALTGRHLLEAFPGRQRASRPDRSALRASQPDRAALRASSDEAAANDKPASVAKAQPPVETTRTAETTRRPQAPTPAVTKKSRAVPVKKSKPS